MIAALQTSSIIFKSDLDPLLIWCVASWVGSSYVTRSALPQGNGSIVLDRLIRRILPVLLFSATYSPSVANSPCLASPSAASVPPYYLTRPILLQINSCNLRLVRELQLPLVYDQPVLDRRHSLLARFASSNFPASPLPTAGAFGLSGRDDTGSLPPSSVNLIGHRSPGWP